MSQFSELVQAINKKDKEMSKGKGKSTAKGGSKNPAIKSGNPAFKPTNNGNTLPKGGKGKLNSSLWRGSSRSK